jgi:hypothetical protein
MSLDLLHREMKWKQDPNGVAVLIDVLTLVEQCPPCNVPYISRPPASELEAEYQRRSGFSGEVEPFLAARLATPNPVGPQASDISVAIRRFAGTSIA